MICALAWGIEYLVEFVQSRRRTSDVAQLPTAAQDTGATPATAAAATTKTTETTAPEDVKL